MRWHDSRLKARTGGVSHDPVESAGTLVVLCGGSEGRSLREDNKNNKAPLEKTMLLLSLS